MPSAYQQDGLRPPLLLLLLLAGPLELALQAQGLQCLHQQLQLHDFLQVLLEQAVLGLGCFLGQQEQACWAVLLSMGPLLQDSALQELLVLASMAAAVRQSRPLRHMMVVQGLQAPHMQEEAQLQGSWLLRHKQAGKPLQSHRLAVEAVLLLHRSLEVLQACWCCWLGCWFLQTAVLS